MVGDALQLSFRKRSLPSNTVDAFPARFLPSLWQI